MTKKKNIGNSFFSDAVKILDTGSFLVLLNITRDLNTSKNYLGKTLHPEQFSRKDLFSETHQFFVKDKICWVKLVHAQ